LAVEQADLNLEPLRHDISLAKERVEQEPTNTELQAMLTRLDQELQAREIELCRLQADRQPGDPTKQLELGIRLLKARQFEAALEAYQRVRNDPKLAWQALVYSGYCYLNQNNWPRAAPLFEEALPLIPADAEATRKEVLFLLACHGAGTATWPKALQYGAELAKLDSSYRGIEEFLTDWRRKALASEA
jgi:tetratricopeptide (TPR) repeat protein